MRDLIPKPKKTISEDKMINERIFKQVAISDMTHQTLLWMQYKLSDKGKKPTMADLISQAVALLDKHLEEEK